MTIAEQARAIAEHLPQPWIVADEGWRAVLSDYTGAQVVIEPTDLARRFEFYIPPAYHQSERGGNNYLSTDHPHITCAVSRGPKAVAADISRRILPAAVAYRQRALAWLQAQTDHDNEIAEANARLLSIPGATPGWDEQIYGDGWRARVSSADYVTVTLNAVTLEQTVAIAAAISANSPAALAAA